ncbi:MAB_1171c family putative transporter [Kutzneria buriramensis]|uniref:DUF6545 domain-containing protein n=1 Tax=Kutzneria buriramensis TaxID=1045776 RepID=A0A3E0GW44_9PSEU|nr:MAB_1171c family putative transporter [Kutzneria buriramensis]REH31089.1 hypothetical protein BCF44_122112 [Kutzneria buriramensis]
MSIFNLVYIVCGALGIILLVYKLPDLRRRWSSPQLWSLCVLILATTLGMTLAAPVFVDMVYAATGVPNLAAPIVYSLEVAYSAAALCLVLFWRFPAEVAWRRVRWIVPCYAGVIVAMAVLFAVSDVHAIRQVDFITYYATEPTVAAFLVAFFVASLIADGALVYQCVKGGRMAAEAGLPWLRRGLRFYATAVWFGVICYVVLLVVIVLDWLGIRQFDPLSTAAPAFGALGIVPGVIGFILPIWGPRRPVFRRWARKWRGFFALRPLHRALRHVNPSAVTVAPGKALDPHHRVRRQLTELNEFRLGLGRYLDEGVREQALSRGRDAGLTGEALNAVVEAAQLKAAVTSARAGVAAPPRSTPVDETRDGDPEAEYNWWVSVARAYSHSPVVAAVVAADGAPNTKLVGG